MKMTIESYGKKMSIETDHDDVGIVEYIDMINVFLLGVGFHQETIINGIKEFIEEKEL
jgi:gamma-glutamyl-gamma-aminobutyrate hydrolase PuuD